MRRPRRTYGKTLGKQILACIFIVLFIIGIKHLDLALVDAMAVTVSSAYHEEIDLKQAADQLQQALIYTQDHLSFSPPFDAVPASTEQEIQIYAIGGGTVLALQPEIESGSTLKLQHGDQAVSIYRGLDHCFVKAGDKVRRGQLIATVEASRTSQFQFQLWMDGKQVDPNDYIEF